MTHDDVYIAEQVERALALDERTHELGVHVEVDGGAVVVLRGEVAGTQRQRLVAQVAAEAAPGLAVRNEVSVTEVLPPDQAET
jgi:osmotically-inducible protein OsmY